MMTFLGIVACLFIVAILALSGFAWYPFVMSLQPSYQEAQAICDSIKPGMTYDEVKNRVGNLFTPPPPTYVDAGGDGQVFLKNHITNFDAHCIIEFRNGRVGSSRMEFVWL
jgi:hypothetical protein